MVTFMRPLLVVGPHDDLIDLLDTHDIPFRLCLDSLTALDMITHCSPNRPQPIVAYGERTFGPATTGQPARIAYDGPQIVLVDTVDANRSKRMTTTLVWHAASALRAMSVVDVSQPKAREMLMKAVRGDEVPGITHKPGEKVRT